MHHPARLEGFVLNLGKVTFCCRWPSTGRTKPGCFREGSLSQESQSSLAEMPGEAHMRIWESRVPVTHKTSYHNTQEAPGIFF